MATMGPWSRVRVAKCQMLATSFFVLVTGRPGGRGLGGWGAVSVTSSAVVSAHTPGPAVRTLPQGHASGAPAVDCWQVAVWAGCPVGPTGQQGTGEAGEPVSAGTGGRRRC